MPTKLVGDSFAPGSITANQLVVGALNPVLTSVAICDSSYNVLDDTAANTGGGFIQVTGTNFTSNSVVVIGTTTATSTTYVNNTTLRAQVQSFAAATYPVYVIDTFDGSTAIRINGITFSNTPIWGTGTTLTGQNSATSFAISLSATSDSSITYSNTTVLPSGTTLLANGYFYGTSNPVSTTTYNFVVKATDTENQDASKSFSITITVPPQTRLYSWGIESNGQVGLNDSVSRSSPVQVGSDTNWNSIKVIRYSAMAIKTNGTLWSWGRNNTGELGLDAPGNRSSPTQVGSDTNWGKIGGIFDNGAAIRTNGTLWTWGSGLLGSTGHNNSVTKSSPTQVGSDTNWNDISVGSYSMAAIRTNGTLWMWGWNTQGQLGLDDTSHKSSPTQVGSDTNWKKVISAERWSAGIKTNGTLWTWGNAGPHLGLNDVAVSRSSPTQVGTLTNWNDISVSTTGFHIMAIKTDSTLWLWGYNNYGQLGQNNIIDKSSPVQVGTGTNWSKISAGAGGNGSGISMAIKTDGTLWSWGRNNEGQLAKNDLIYRSSPVQIGTNTNWSDISAGGHTAIGITLN